MNEEMNADEMNSLTAALERAPVIAVPDDFVARVMARVPQQPSCSIRRFNPMPVRTRYGRSAAVVGVLMLMIAMVLLAPRTAGSSMWITLQAVLFTEFAGLLLWLGISRHRA